MQLVLVCLSIFLARIIDVSIGTVRTIVMVKGHTKQATILAFFEVFIWFFAARQALATNYNQLLIAIFYSGGYACGTYIGSILSNIFIKGTTTVQVITSKATKKNLELIRSKGYAVSAISITDDYDGIKKKMLILEINNRDLKNLTKLIRSIDSNAFITSSETKAIVNGFIK